METEAGLRRPTSVTMPIGGSASAWVFAAIVLVTLGVELILAERQFFIFRPGYNQSHPIDQAPTLIAFLAGLLACHVLIFYLLLRLVKLVHRRAGDSPICYLNFAAIGLAGWLGMLAARYQMLSYFSDVISLEIIRNIGGGSLINALLFVVSDAALLLVAIAIGIALYVAAMVRLRRRWKSAPHIADRVRLTRRQTWLVALLAPALMFGLVRNYDVRLALARFCAPIAVVAVLHELTDFDRDEFSFFSQPADADPLDPDRHPYALDIPNNGIDEDGFNGDLRFAGAPDITPPPIIRGPRRHVILIVLESTRGDAMGRRIAGRPVAPTMEALAASGTYVSQAYSHVALTAWSLRSLFTGLLVPEDGRQSLFRDFRANGYEFDVFSTHSEEYGGTATRIGMRDAATIYVDADMYVNERVYSSTAPGWLITDGRLALREFDRRLGNPAQWRRPHFIYFNLQGAHYPYWWPSIPTFLPGGGVPRTSISIENRDWVARSYWNAVAFNDWLIAGIIARLRRLGVYENSLIVITADHGESLFDDRFLGHGHMLNDQQTRIPFILSDRNVPIEAPIGLADMRRIILRAAGATVPAPSYRRAPVAFQYLRNLHRPAQIAMVDATGNRTTFDFFREAVWTSATDRWTRYSELAPGSSERRAADLLLEEWARQRWLAHVQSGTS